MRRQALESTDTEGQKRIAEMVAKDGLAAFVHHVLEFKREFDEGNKDEDKEMTDADVLDWLRVQTVEGPAADAVLVRHG